MRRLKVLAVDDHRLMLDAIRAVLDREDDILLVAETDAADVELRRRVSRFRREDATP